MGADTTCGLRLQSDTVLQPEAINVGQAEGHFERTAVTLTHLQILQALQDLDPVHWQKREGCFSHRQTDRQTGRQTQTDI